LAELQTNLWLARHGETEWSTSGRLAGRTDVPLTPEGERRAVDIGRHLGGRAFTLVLTSPLTRALETCRLAGYAEKAERCDDLLEWDYGAYDGRTTPEIRKMVPDWTIWTGKTAGGETPEQVGERVRRVIERAVAAGGDVALFAHGHVLRVLAACWVGLPPGAGGLFALGTASLSILGFEREARVITLWNQTPDLMTRERSTGS